MMCPMFFYKGLCQKRGELNEVLVISDLLLQYLRKAEHVRGLCPFPRGADIGGARISRQGKKRPLLRELPLPGKQGNKGNAKPYFHTAAQIGGIVGLHCDARREARLLADLLGHFEKITPLAQADKGFVGKARGGESAFVGEGMRMMNGECQWLAEQLLTEIRGKV